MTRTLQTATDIGGTGSQITEAGTYQYAVLEATDGETTKGNPMSGCSAVLSVLAGTAEGQEEKQFNLHLFDPDLSKSESNQEWATKKQTAWAIAGNQLDPSKLGESIEMNLGDALVGQQGFITLEENEYNGKTSLQLSYANIYHIDDPRAAKFPRNKEAIELLPKEHRKPAAFFEPLQKKSAPKAAPKLDTSDL